MRRLIRAAVLGIGLPMGVVFCSEGTLAQTLHEMKRHDEAILRNGISLSGSFREWSPLGDRTTIAGLARYQRFQLTFNQQIAVYDRVLESFDELPKRTPPTDSEGIDRSFIYDEDGAQHFIFDARIRALYQRGILNAYLKTVPTAREKTYPFELLKVPPASRGNRVGAQRGSPREAGGATRERGNYELWLGD